MANQIASSEEVINPFADQPTDSGDDDQQAISRDEYLPTSSGDEDRSASSRDEHQPKSNEDKDQPASSRNEGELAHGMDAGQSGGSIDANGIKDYQHDEETVTDKGDAAEKPIKIKVLLIY